MEQKLERSQTPIRLVASEAIGFRYLKVLIQARKVLKDKKDIERIHKLRKSGKTLRYLVDLFADLYPVKDANKVIKDLKTFQDCLGGMQDCEVQINLVSELSDSMNAEFEKDGRQVIERFINKQQKQKKKLHKQAIKLIKKYSNGSSMRLDSLVSL